MANEATLRLVRRFEGFEPRVYRDAAGHPTIGYGHLLVRNGSVESGRAALELEGMVEPITLEEGERLLLHDVARAEREMSAAFGEAFDRLNENQRGALTSMAFNLGAATLAHAPDFSGAVRIGLPEALVEQMERWVHAGSPPRRLEGLVRRRAAEVQLFETPVGAGAAEPQLPQSLAFRSGDQWYSVNRLEFAPINPPDADA